MGFVHSLSIVSFAVLGAQAAVSSTGFTVSLAGVDYFLPPKPVARIAGCETLQSLCVASRSQQRLIAAVSTYMSVEHQVL